MSTFFMFGKYVSETSHQVSAERTRQARELIERLGGRVKGIYALLGEYDVVLIVELPRMAEAMHVSLQLRRLTGISFFTSAAVPVEEFDELAEKAT